jgi:hypothetical protein
MGGLDVLTRPLPFLLAVILFVLLHSTANAQFTQPRTQVELTGYLSLSKWEGQGQLVGGGIQFESAVSHYLSFYGDLGLAAVATGCDALVGAACPSTYWHVLGGIRLYPFHASAFARPYLSIATGPMTLGNSWSLLWAGAGLLVHASRSVAVQVGGYYSFTYRSGPRLWGGLSGLRIRL